MANHDFVKGECPFCGGHLEFPADAAGQTIPCPHCGQTTELRETASVKAVTSRRLAALAATLCCFIGAAAALFIHRSHPTAVSAPPPVPIMPATNMPAPNTPETEPAVSIPAKPTADEPRPGEVLTNSFGISGGKMQNTPGSSLVYVLGTVRNLADRQRFGVKVDYALFDTNGKVIGHATDYQSEIDPHGEWDFKALVMESKAVSAQFTEITEQ